MCANDNDAEVWVQVWSRTHEDIDINWDRGAVWIQAHSTKEQKEFMSCRNRQSASANDNADELT